MISIYKASAGSGKTFRLTHQYILFLLGEKQDDGSYRLRKKQGRNHRDILAVTFTNKATDEMKRRIIHELAVLAGMEPGWKEKSPHADDLVKELRCSPEELGVAAREALKRLLFDFGFFNVSTIDAFFQNVLRTFAREAELAGNYELEIDSSYAIGLSVAKTLSDISLLTDEESRRDHRMLWVLQYMETQVKEGRKFNVFNRNSPLYTRLVKMVNSMLGEDFDTNSEAIGNYLADPERLFRFNEAVQKYLRELRSQGSAVATAALHLCNEHGTPEDLLRAALCKALRKWADSGWGVNADGSVGKAIENTARDGSEAFTAAVLKKHKGINELIGAGLSQACDDLKKIVDTNNFLRMSVANTFLLGLMGQVLANLKKYCTDNNLFLLSDTNELLRKIIGDSDVPVVYERMGVWLKHFLIDEFQDTSAMQWRNLRPLLSESNANENDNLIIGDEKQCIYRFRNSDPGLLNKKVQGDFPDSRLSGSSLSENTNWRSSADIVRFNNTLFTLICKSEEFLDGIYGNVVQQIAGKNEEKEGYVRIEMIESINADDFMEQSLEVMARQIRGQLRAGYKPSDIAVLTRYNSEGGKVIDYLFSISGKDDMPVFNVVSDDSLLITTSPAVRFIVSVLRYMTAADVATSRNVSERKIARILNRFEYLRSHQPSLPVEEAIAQAIDSLAAATDTDVEGYADEKDMIKSVSLGSLVERIVNNYVPEASREAENVYISAFQDTVADFCDRGEGDIQSFLQWWDATGCRTTVSTPESDDSIRVMTIHKAKGLEFPCVHIPFATWKLDDVSDIKWFDVDPQWYVPYVEDASLVPPMLPLRTSSAMLKTPFRPRYKVMVEEETVDQINVAYVAFTRAVKELIVQFDPNAKGLGSLLNNVLGKMESEDVRRKMSEELLATLPKSTSNPFVEEVSVEGAVLEVGDYTTPDEKKKEERTAMDATAGGVMPPYTGRDHPEVWKKLDIERELDFTRSRDRGIILHAVMRNVYHPGDVAAAARRLAVRGLIPDGELDGIVEHLENRISSTEARRWFEGYSRVLMERPIASGGEMPRPDRVVWTADGTVDVVDYKFGEPNPVEYADQVRGYMDLLTCAGWTNVRGFIWYLDTGIIVPVPHTTAQ